jgi:hypothetical protein
LPPTASTDPSTNGFDEVAYARNEPQKLPDALFDRYVFLEALFHHSDRAR